MATLLLAASSGGHVGLPYMAFVQNHHHAWKHWRLAHSVTVFQQYWDNE